MSTRKVGKLFINGSWVEPNQGKTLEAVNPATEEVIQLFANATKEDVDAAVAAAEAAFPAWSSKTGAERATYLLKIVAEIEKVKDELATTETLDNGKSLRESAADVSDTMSTFNYYAELAKQLDTKQGTKIDVGDNNFDVRVRYEAAGVAGLIIPFNYPLLMAAWKVAPALAAGCTVVLKPSEMTSLSALELANCIHRAGVPAGVFNLITGTGRDAGEPLSNHPSVAKIAFTGSCATGTRVMTTAAQTMKKVTLELGGKSPIIVFPDCDLEKTLEWVAFGIFVNQGQVCSATSRLIIHESIADRFLQQMKEKSQLIKMGNGLEEGVELGPIVSKVQYERVKSYISKGVEEGATLLCGGLPQNINKGYFVLPTVFTNVKPNMTIWREEVFGPVLAVMTFRDEDQAIKLANETEFGLGAAVMSGDEQRCDRVARALRAGIVWINSSQPTFIQAPWGGMKRSGIGRELGTWGLDNYLEVKQVTKNVGGDKLGWYSRL